MHHLEGTPPEGTTPGIYTPPVLTSTFTLNIMNTKLSVSNFDKFSTILAEVQELWPLLKLTGRTF